MSQMSCCELERNPFREERTKLMKMSLSCNMKILQKDGALTVVFLQKRHERSYCCLNCARDGSETTMVWINEQYDAVKWNSALSGLLQVRLEANGHHSRKVPVASHCGNHCDGFGNRTV